VRFEPGTDMQSLETGDVHKAYYVIRMIWRHMDIASPHTSWLPHSLLVLFATDDLRLNRAKEMADNGREAAYLCSCCLRFVLFSEQIKRRVFGMGSN
jgi:hypothetical protein